MLQNLEPMAQFSVPSLNCVANSLLLVTLLFEFHFDNDLAYAMHLLNDRLVRM
jgi:hypothetical protein